MTGKACDAWKQLGGIVCAYKPAGTSWHYLLSKVKSRLCEDLNSLKTRPAKTYLDIDRSGDELSINVRPSYGDNVLCVGPRYQNRNIEIRVPTPLGDITSGVQIVCINCGYIMLKALQNLHFTKCYHIKGILGQATRNYHIDEKVIARAKFDRIKKNEMEKVLASYQSAAQKRVFYEYGVPLKSQEAYNFALKGLYRPVWKGPPIIYGLKLLHFKPPDFTIEVQCICETEVHLMNLIHNLGISLKSYATCTEIRCLREGCFHVEHALVKNQWNLKDILDNIKLCWGIIEKYYPHKVQYFPTVFTSKSKCLNESSTAR